MKYHLKVSTIFVALSHSIAAVIPGDASVQTGSGVKILHEVMVGERVLSANREMDGLAHEQVLMNRSAGRRNSTIQIDLVGKRKVKAAPDQLFFDPLKEDWIKAEDLTAENALFGDNLRPINILDVKRKSGLAMKTRMVSIAAGHQLFVNGVLTHNMMFDYLAKALMLREGYYAAKEVVSYGKEESANFMARDAAAEQNPALAVVQDLARDIKHGPFPALSGDRKPLRATHSNSFSEKSYKSAVEEHDVKAMDPNCKYKNDRIAINPDLPIYASMEDAKGQSSFYVANGTNSPDLVIRGFDTSVSDIAAAAAPAAKPGAAPKAASAPVTKKSAMEAPKMTAKQVAAPAEPKEAPKVAPKQESKPQEEHKPVYCRASDGKAEENPYSCANGKPVGDSPYSRDSDASKQCEHNPVVAPAAAPKKAASKLPMGTPAPLSSVVKAAKRRNLF